MTDPKTLLTRYPIARKLRGKRIQHEDTVYRCVSVHPFGITLQDDAGGLHGIEWKDTGKMREVK